MVSEVNRNAIEDAGLSYIIGGRQGAGEAEPVRQAHRRRQDRQPGSGRVFAALAVTRLIEDRTGRSIKKFGRTYRRHRLVRIRAGNQILTAADPVSRDLRDVLALIN